MLCPIETDSKRLMLIYAGPPHPSVRQGMASADGLQAVPDPEAEPLLVDAPAPRREALEPQQLPHGYDPGERCPECDCVKDEVADRPRYACGTPSCAFLCTSLAVTLRVTRWFVCVSRCLQALSLLSGGAVERRLCRRVRGSRARSIFPHTHVAIDCLNEGTKGIIRRSRR